MCLEGVERDVARCKIRKIKRLFLAQWKHQGEIVANHALRSTQQRILVHGVPQLHHAVLVVGVVVMVVVARAAVLPVVVVAVAAAAVAVAVAAAAAGSVTVADPVAMGFSMEIRLDAVHVAAVAANHVVVVAAVVAVVAMAAPFAPAVVPGVAMGVHGAVRPDVAPPGQRLPRVYRLAPVGLSS